MGSIVSDMRTALYEKLEEALERAIEKGELKVNETPDFTIEVPREDDHGDFACNIAMLLAKQARMAPRKIAEVILNNLVADKELLLQVEIAGPGFINFYLKPNWAHPVIAAVEKKGKDFGRLDIGRGKRVQVEFVSANPTGLLHMGNARGAALGDSIASILDFAGYEVSREFYINDAGKQIENFGRSLEARYFQQFGHDVEIPEDGYHGEDIIETVKGFINIHGDKYLQAEPELRKDALTKYALNEKIRDIKSTLENFGVHYDVWFSEQSLHEKNAVQSTMDRLGEKGYIYESEQAQWFKATAFGDKKDEVLIRSNGQPTYFAADIAYHKDKFDRGFNWVINVWGADHHGHVNRMKGAVEALGYNPDALTVVIMQLVRLFRGGEIVRMSKRSGQYITLEELVEEVGRDAARYFFVMRGSDSHLDFDLDLAREQSNENPVFYVQYAHARICSIFRQYREAGRDAMPADAVNLDLLDEEAEIALIRKLADFPEELTLAVETLAPNRIARYVHELAGLFHSFYNSHRIIVEDEELSAARLALAGATRTVLANALNLLGVTAPERM